MCKAMEELILEERKEMVIEMLQDGKLSDEDIAKYCHVSLDVVKNIKKSPVTQIV